MAGMIVSGLLALTKIIVGLLANSTSVVADGVESASDVLASGIVLFGLFVAAKPPDEDHPYGHGRFETITGLGVGMILALTGTGICIRSVQTMSDFHSLPSFFGIWPLLISIAAKACLSFFKFHFGRQIRSDALVADAWNDGVDVLSGTVALVALSLTLYNPARFVTADHYGGLGVGLIVIFLGLRVVHQTSMTLMDTMPDDETIKQIRAVALTVPGALGIEKCYARKTGLQYHVDLHLEVDPGMSVRDSHGVATEVRIKIKETLDWVADVLVHVEPFGA
jgi:cation diffusion facilitator family transporter